MTRAQLVAALSLLSALIMVGGTCSLLAVEVPPPPLPPPPRSRSLAETQVTQYRFTERFYRALLQEDARHAGIQGFSPDALREPNVHAGEFRGKQALKPGGEPLETEHLRISLRRSKDWVVADEQRYRVGHLILRIENRSDNHIAYVVQTSMSDPVSCAARGIRDYNAVALRPREAIERSECLDQPGNVLSLLRVEVMRLTPLGYHYVSRLLPLQLGIDPRLAEGHRVPDDRPCGHVPVPAGSGDRLDRWRDLVDFYSRHNCDEYTFFDGYQRVVGRLPELRPARPAPPPATP